MIDELNKKYRQDPTGINPLRRIACRAMLTVAAILIVVYLFQWGQLMLIKNQTSQTRDYILEMGRKRLAQLPISERQRIKLGHPGGVPTYACNFWSFEYWWRECVGIQAFSYTTDFRGMDLVGAILANPCMHLELLHEKNRSVASEHFGCGSELRLGKVVVIGFQVTEHILAHGGKYNEKSKKFTFTFEYGD